METLTLIAALRRAGDGTPREGAIYLPNARKPKATTPCVWLDPDTVEDFGPDGIPAAARAAGFAASGLDMNELHEVYESARQLEASPSDALLVEAFVYYWRYDAFLPRRGAGPPPARNIHREFYDRLGPERPGTRCTAEGCSRGTVEFSVRCRTHQFEQVWGRDCPFTH